MATLSIRHLAETLDAIDARTTRMERQLDEIHDALRALISMTARLPDGRTLINAVGMILHEVEND